MKMNKILAIVAVVAMVVGVAFDTNAQTDRQRRKALENQYKQKKKEFSKNGWKLTGSAQTIDVLLMKHYDKLNANPSNYEIVGEVSACNSINVCKQVAFNNAITEYANKAGSHVKGRIASDANLDQSAGQGEFDKFYAAYERLVSVEVKNVLQSSFSVVREKQDGTKAFQSLFVVDENIAANARMQAMKQAAEETKLAQEYATKITEFVKEGFEE
jgi:hypothetical protein